MALTSLRRIPLQFCHCSAPFAFKISHLSSSSSDSNAFECVMIPSSAQHSNDQSLDKHAHAESWRLFTYSHRIQGCYLPFGANFKRFFSATRASCLPHITDPDIDAAFKDLMALNWDEIPDSVVSETKMALSKSTEDVAGKEILANVFRAAEASVEFGSVLVSLRMTLDDLGGLSGENVGHLPNDLEDAMVAAYKRYMTYLDSFGPDEGYLRKKVETELGTKMVHIKMRCSGIGSEWGKVSLLGTSGISGSYVEYRA